MALLAHRHSLAIKARLLFERRVVVTAVTFRRRPRQSRLETPRVARAEQVVLVSDLTSPIRQALAYSQSLGIPARAVHIDVDDDQCQRVIVDWESAGIDMPLDVVASPYRGIVDPLLRYLRERRRQALPGTLVCAVIPEFVVPGRIPQILHNQTGLAIKAALTSEGGLAVIDVPYHLEPPSVANGNRHDDG